MNPDNAEAIAYRGLCKYHLKDFEGAIRDYNKALEMQPVMPKYMTSEESPKVNLVIKKGHVPTGKSFRTWS